MDGHWYHQQTFRKPNSVAWMQATQTTHIPDGSGDLWLGYSPLLLQGCAENLKHSWLRNAVVHSERDCPKHAQLATRQGIKQASLDDPHCSAAGTGVLSSPDSGASLGVIIYILCTVLLYISYSRVVFVVIIEILSNLQNFSVIKPFGPLPQ